MQLLDTTLREGEQAAGISFTLKQKKSILIELDNFGIDFVELGHPAVSEIINKQIITLAKIKTNAQKLVHARAVESDVRLAAKSGAEYVGIFISTSDIGINAKYSFGKKECLQKINDSVSLANELGLKVRFTAEDATRTDYNYLIKAFNTAKKAGAERLSIADSVGCMTPNKISELVKNVKKDTKGKIHVHCHNDTGLAVANSIAGLETGAILADVTVNGIGERSGIADLAQVSAVLKEHYGENTRNTENLPMLSSMVAKFSGSAVPEFNPVVGKNSFSHKSGLHTTAVLNDPRSYEFLPPQSYGRERTIVVDQFTGRAAFKHRLEELGIKLTEENLEKAFKRLKESPKRWISDSDIREIAMSIDTKIKHLNGIGIEGFVSIYLDKTVMSPNLSTIVSNIPGVERVYETSGDADIVAFTITDSITEMNELLDKINYLDGVKRTASKIVMRELTGGIKNTTNTK